MIPTRPIDVVDIRNQIMQFNNSDNFNIGLTKRCKDNNISYDSFRYCIKNKRAGKKIIKALMKAGIKFNDNINTDMLFA